MCVCAHTCMCVCACVCPPHNVEMSRSDNELTRPFIMLFMQEMYSGYDVVLHVQYI